jgi:hypothetical protein
MVSGQGTIRKFEHFAGVPVKIPMLHRYPASFLGGYAWGNLSKLFCVVVNFCALTLFAFVAPVARGEHAEPKLHPEIRQALAQNFPYQPEIRAKTQEQSASEVLQPQGELDPEVVVLPKFEVRSRALDRDLPAAIANYKSTAPQNHSKLGTGIHEKDFGKVRLSCVTVLYIPIQVGIGW